MTGAQGWMVGVVAVSTGCNQRKLGSRTSLSTFACDLDTMNRNGLLQSRMTQTVELLGMAVELPKWMRWADAISDAPRGVVAQHVADAVKAALSAENTAAA
mmetsp:Transcript_29297/g.75521  ORF Transcript_29297/g.75521 Transcript_29297/m.75521 type:complete len:101 (-) Transcript_29297:462-764(-)|eukprot:CAMPEP_0115862534 /NCGR_PEP_ID=MMETSP0287-20121206/18224_1 /TAXON_ID=412157 /ORGANISM="Chrysochromulina rotalis, Strain UIO044" /LENGTH=100 /DNA_ID=CAMNT_0003316955 /DNA_START=1136 /DNA_END=1438 /DNA_ORIENTATION=+